MALEISLAQFNKIATGDYNAGQIDVRTNKDGQAELVKVNNHVWRKSQNTTVLSPERILEVKELFVNALCAGGVNPAKLAEIREQLGIPSDLAASLNTDERHEMMNRRFTPLTRQAVREIRSNRSEITVA